MSSYECPYAVGAGLVLLLDPPLTTPTDSQHPRSTPTQLVIKILEICSFTKSQTLKISVVSKSIEDNPVPSIAFLKLYDRRYLDERTGNNAFYPWNHQKEAKAEAIARASAKTVRANGGYNFDDHTSESSAEEDSHVEESDGTDDELNPWEVEEYYRDLVRKWFKTEAAAYNQLESLQGLCVPKFFGTVTFDRQSLSRMPPGILTEVRGVLLQFIDGKPLDEIDIESPLVHKHKHIGQASVICFERIHSLGVLHGDVRLGNLMIRDSDGRVFLLDFALATLRGKDEDDQEWIEHVRRENEVFAIKQFLQQKELRDLTPPEPFTWARKGYAYYNSLIQKSPDAWRMKYYERISDEPRFETRSDADGEFDYIFPNWRIKKETTAARMDYLANINQLISVLDIDKER
jgi:tRNA A-37 threonylcarbamoyl transferase component Bud32